jgi:hypothetical protein
MSRETESKYCRDYERFKEKKNEGSLYHPGSG